MNAPLALTHQVRAADLASTREIARIAEFLAEADASLFHTPHWLRAVERGTGQRAHGLVTEQLGAITGWLPLTEVRSVLFGRALVSSGFAVGGGVCACSGEAARALIAAAETLACAQGCASLELRGGLIPAGEGWRSWDDKHCGFEAPLAGDDAAQLLAIPRKARAEVRKGLANDLQVRIGRSREDLAAHYAVYSESVRNLGTPVFPASLFRAMLEAFPEASDILTVFKADAPIASVLSFYHAGAVLPYWGGGTHEARAERANELMYYELMLHARRRGMEKFDFGRSKTGSGPYHFKKNWGFLPVPLVYGQWSPPGTAGRDVDPTSAAYSRKIELWKKLPLPIANALGPWIARGLA
ncbi:MAG: FemAB family XrtA/PEP-CTERM system-associated protein [Erythrobacter sp.]|jgi:FemAB-related protein (PEP-CTERM system-associated)|nr:FemAB family XrtA/PEP-CTERM system-associated protein [Erythrobacter sp.]